MPGTGPGGLYTAMDLGYDDPELLRQLNYGAAAPAGTAAAAYNPYNQTRTWQTTNAPKPLAARTAFTGIPIGYNVRNLALNPLANVNDASVDLSGLVNKSDPCQYIPGEGPVGDAARAACRAAAGLFFPSSSGPAPLAGPTGPCPKDYHQKADGSCEADGLGPYLPGDIGRPDVIWTPINGRFGQGARPVAVQATHLACPSGMVLGKDNVCYEHLARTNRKWNPGHKPLLTGGDMNAIRKTKSLAKRWQKVAPAFHKKVVASGARLVKRPKGKG